MVMSSLESATLFVAQHLTVHLLSLTCKTFIQTFFGTHHLPLPFLRVFTPHHLLAPVLSCNSHLLTLTNSCVLPFSLVYLATMAARILEDPRDPDHNVRIYDNDGALLAGKQISLCKRD
jgi:hypothetical protein